MTSYRNHKQSICENCGKLYGKKHSNQRFCSPRCGQLGQPYYRNRITVEKQCLICGKNFSTSKRRQKYCSRECCIKANRVYLASYRKKHQSSFLKMRFQILQRDKFRCRYCGRGALDGAKLEIDHVLAKKLNGANELSNYVTACSECNVGKSDVLLLANKNGQLPTFISI